jgi:hypothetical protein
MTSRKTGLIAIAALAAFPLATTTASAQPLTMTFSEARANVGVQLDDAALFEPPATAPFGAELDPGSGSITAGDLQMPEFSTFITDPIEADVTVDFELGVITGSYTQASGALTLTGEAGGILFAQGKECIVATTPAVLTLSTSKNSGGANPRDGEYFTDGLTGPGAIAGRWTDMSATPAVPGVGEAFCESVEERIGGPGGIWLKQDDLEPDQPDDMTQPKAPIETNATPSPPLPVCVVPKLAGKTLARAKAMLRASNCRVGKVRRSSQANRTGSRLVVKSSFPGVGASPANGKVHLKLGPRHPNARS